MNAELQTAKCRLCGCRLDPGNPREDLVREICADCRSHPAARRLGAVTPAAKRSGPGGAREFTAAEKTLVRRVYGYMAPTQILALLNERLQADLGPDASLYTLDQLYAEIQGLPAGGVKATDWSDLRKYLAAARKAGLLDQVSAQVIDDFAVVFALTPAQVLRLKDVVLTAKET